MKLNLIKFLKSSIQYIKSLGWIKEDVKKIIMFIIMLLIACFILSNFLTIKTKVRGGIYTDTSVSGSVDTDTTVSGFIDVDR